ncbi:protein PERCC1 [Pogona vitticeps]
MAAGVIQSLSKFRLAPGFQHLFLSSTTSQEMALHDSSEEEEMEEEEEEAEEEEVEGGGGGRGEEMEATDDDLEGHGPRGKQETPTVAADLSGAEMTAQLLQFAERVSKDIQRYFGRKSQDDDSEACNIYEDRGSPQLSGRLLYYTDLVRISQSRAPEEDNEDDEDLPPASKPTWRSLGSKAEEDERLGPLAELFEYALCRYAKPQAPHDPEKLRMERKYGHLSPMHGRKLPQSFWKEPAFSPIGVLGSSNPPDFSDLLANWTSETSQEELHAS